VNPNMLLRGISGSLNYKSGPVTPKPGWAAVRIDFRWAWLIPLLILIYAPSVRGQNAAVVWPTLIAAIACLLAMASSGYSLTSFVSIVAFTHLLFYPIAALGNLLLPFPLVRPDLWVDTDKAMWGCTVGVLALALGAFLSGHVARPARPSSRRSRLQLPSFKFNLLLTLLILPVFLSYVSLGLYFHSTITGSKVENNFYANLLFLAKFIALSGIFLQTFRYCRTRSTRDGYWAVAFCILHILIFLPSGSRWTAFGFLPLLIPAYVTWEFNTYRKIMVLLVVMVVIPAFSYGIGKYRGSQQVALLSSSEKFTSALQSPFSAYTTETQDEAALGVVISRFSDYVAAGRIIADTPNVISYRGFEQLDNLWQIFVPGFLDILPERINLNDGADLCDKYGVTKSNIQLMSGTSPPMVIGDFFSRWGWTGIVLGMAVLGFILRQIDLRMLSRWDTFAVLFYLFFGRHVLGIVSASVVNVFMIFSRELLTMTLIAYVLARWSNRESPRDNPQARLPVSNRFSGKISI
jgi:hypothetical protein